METLFPRPRYHYPTALVAVAFIALLGCKRGRSTGKPKPIPTTTACDTLDRAECLNATHCTLTHVARAQYDCRKSVERCEVGLRQRDRTTCESRGACKWDPGGCYCPFPGYGSTKVKDKGAPGGACACAGGKPPRCVPAGPAPVPSAP